MSWIELVEDGIATNVHVGLILKLQGIHDLYCPDNWREELSKLAKDYKLEIPQ